MKHDLKKQICQLLVFLIFIFVIVAAIFLIAAGANHLINKVTFWTCAAFLVFIGYQDAKWLDKHFIDGEWQ